MALEGQQLGRYRLMSVLGSGGMGEVYLAEDSHLRRQVAIKVIRAEVASYPDASVAQESARLFKREIRAIAMLDHPHILPLFDYGEEIKNGVELTYMVMPLRQEGSLSVWFKQHGEGTPLSPQVVAHIIRQASSALQYAHQHQVVHQDVKLANFLIRSSEDEPDLPDLLLADFGVAKLFTGTASMSQTSRGTPAFMAPEQWSGTPTPATDQYALAIMAYQLITGKVPFNGRSEQVMYQHFNVQPEPPSKYRAQLPRDVDTVILRALGKKPEERFASIAAFSRALQQALLATSGSSMQKLVAGPPPAMTRTSVELPAIAHPSTGPVSMPGTGTYATVNPPSPFPPGDGHLRTTLAISTEEARTGTQRTITLPGGRQVNVRVPANTSNGHILRMDGQGMRAPTGELGALIVTINVKNPHEERPATSANNAQQMTFLNPSAQQRQSSALAPIKPSSTQQPIGGLQNKLPLGLAKLSRKQIVLLIGICIILIGSVSYSIFYFKYDNLLQRNSLLQTAISNSYDSSMQTLSLNDPLKDNSNGYFWYEGSANSYSCTLTGTDYQVTVSQGSRILDPYCTAGPTFTDFTYEVQMRLMQGDREGIVFHATPSTNSYYSFRVGTNGGYNLDVYQNGHLLGNLANDVLSQPLNASTNTIAVVAKGSTISLFVNGTKLQDVTDSTLAQGQIGVAVESVSNTTQAAFQNARVWV